MRKLDYWNVSVAIDLKGQQYIENQLKGTTNPFVISSTEKDITNEDIIVTVDTANSNMEDNLNLRISNRPKILKKYINGETVRNYHYFLSMQKVSNQRNSQYYQVIEDIRIY